MPDEFGFPTEEEFLAWWDGREDCFVLSSSPDMLRGRTCPIARYLLAHGHRYVAVTINGWRSSLQYMPRKLPQWAIRFILCADAMKTVYSGLPDGFKPSKLTVAPSARNGATELTVTPSAGNGAMPPSVAK